MSDNTTLPTASGGDVIRTDSVTTSTQDSGGTITTVEVKVQAIKILTGADGRDDGFVSQDNPLYVEDAKARRLLESINCKLDRIIELLEVI